VQPVLDEEHRFFWTSGADGRLRFLRCQSCGYYLHPPIPRCPRCGSREVEPEVVSGRGELWSYTVNHQSWDGSTEPYVICWVQLLEQEGLRLTSNLIGCDPDQVRIGMPVRVVFERHGEVWFPIFEPDPDAEVSP
jgi:uncharacterized OB-fold protein